MTTAPLYVIKLGSATLRHPGIFAEIAEVRRRGARVLVVCGGAEGIARHYENIGRPVPEVTLRNGDTARYCPPQEMPHLVAAYETITLPRIRDGLAGHGLEAFAAIAAHGALVTGRANRPLATVAGGRARIIRDHRAGTVTSVNTGRLRALLDAHDVVCLSPPVMDEAGGPLLNVDADMLAAELSNALDADHLRLVTGTAGILTDITDPGSTLRDAVAGTAAPYVAGRMKQKVRAAELALKGTADVAIAGPHTMADRAGWTRFWPTEPDADLALLSRSVGIPSVSRDERELALFLADWCQDRKITAEVDEAGNLVAERGDGPRTLLLLGHLDTVPFRWPVRWRDSPGVGTVLTGRGSVDAKAPLSAFLQVLADAAVPAGWRLRVVGAVEEEISSSKGAFHVRDHHTRADAVVIGEPSGSGALTLGYHGLFKLRVSVSVPSGHSAGRDAVSAPDRLMESLSDIRAAVLKEADGALSAVIDMSCGARADSQSATAVLNFRVPPGADPGALCEAAGRAAGPDAEITVLRATPGYASGRSTVLARSFTRGFRREGIRPRFLLKKGTSDMNTLATAWRDVPMVAFGPGDSSLDHTDSERIGAEEYRRGRAVLRNAVEEFFALASAESAEEEKTESSR